MRCCLIIVFVFVTIVASAQNKTDTSPKPLVTPVSKPFGNIASAKIDRRGGKLKSDDGGVEIIIPENALDSETTISIQSSHNDVDESDEGAYQFEPSGINFKNPVQLIFHYRDDNDDLKSIAWQSADGKWHRTTNAVADSVQKTVSCFALHFSRWSRFDRIKINPRMATVKVNKLVYFKIYSLDDLGDVLNNKSDGDVVLAAPHPVHYFSGDWTANGIINGNGETGIVTKQDNRDAYYKAPSVVPASNPVAVSVQIFSDKNQKLLLTSNVTVIGDQYHLTFIHVDENGCFFVVDSSSCILSIQKDKVGISNIDNHKPFSDWPNCPKSCKTVWTNKESFKGIVEITGIAGSSVSSAEGKLTSVNIAFAPAMGNTPSQTTTCKGSPPFSIPSMPRPADPRTINFDIDGDDVIIHFSGKTSRNELVLEGKNEKTMIYIYKVN